MGGINKENINTSKSIKKITPKMLELHEKFVKLSSDKLLSPKFRKYTRPGFSNKDVTEKAYVSLLMLNEDYLPSLLVLGHSLKQFKNKYNLVCLVQDKKETKIINGEKKELPGVSKKAIDDILKVFDVVYGADLLQLTPPKSNRHFTEQIKHYQNICLYVTKCQVYGLLDYKQILYLDASTVVHKNLDYLFKEHPDNSFLYDSTVNRAKMGIHGALFLVKPSKLYYTKSIFLIKYYQKVFGNLFFKRGIDETILYFSVFPEWSTSLIKLWTRCTEDYSFKKCPVYHYQIHKPFRPLVDEPNNKKITFKIWDKFAKSLLTSHPEFLDYFKHIREFRNIDF